jgi:hypothetical protein
VGPRNGRKRARRSRVALSNGVPRGIRTPVAGMKTLSPGPLDDGDGVLPKQRLRTATNTRHRPWRVNGIYLEDFFAVVFFSAAGFAAFSAAGLAALVSFFAAGFALPTDVFDAGAAGALPSF